MESVASSPFPGARAEAPIGLDGLPFVDAQTTRDLDIFPRAEGEPSVFSLLDRTRTNGGRKALARMLISGQIDLPTILRRHEAIRFFADPARRERWTLRSSDRSVAHVERYIDSYVPPLTGARGPIYWARSLWFRASYPQYFEYLDSCVRNLHRFLRGLAESRDGQEGQLPEELAQCRESIHQLLDHPHVVDFLRAGGTYSRFRPHRVLHFDERFRRELAPLLHRTVEAVYQLDLFVALGTATEELSLVFPSVSDPASDTTWGDPEAERSAPEIVCEGVFHPFLAVPTPNDLRLDANQGFLFLTGPNMAGKTTLMKALALSVYMAHLGLPVPCHTMRLRLLDGLFSSLNVEDNLGKGHSFFYSEVRRVREVSEQLHEGRRLLVLFDELFKGTNLKDALDGSRLVVDGFRRFTGSAFILSSHLLELGEELGNPVPNRTAGPAARPNPAGIPIRFLRFDAEVREGRPHFSYRLQEGVSTKRLGMLILENERIPALLQGPRKFSEKGTQLPPQMDR